MQTERVPQTPSNSEYRALLVLLAGTGLRIGEALAIGLGNTWDPTQGTITVSGTLVMGTFQTSPKTKAGKRVVDLAPEVNDLLKATYPDGGALFPMSEDTYRRKFKALGIEGFHALRRFRITHLELNDVPRSLTKFWAGHASSDISERYMKTGKDLTARKEWATKVGLGFQV